VPLSSYPIGDDAARMHVESRARTRLPDHNRSDDRSGIVIAETGREPDGPRSPAGLVGRIRPTPTCW